MPTDDVTDPNAQMIEPAIGDEDMTDFLKSLEEGFEYAPNVNLSTFAPQGDTPSDSIPDDPPDDDDGEEDDSEGETPEADDDTDTVTVLGKQFPRADIERLYQFDQFLRDNPDKAQRVAEALAIPDGQPTPVPTAPAPTDSVAFTPPTVPDDVDLDDPTIKFMWDNMVEARKEAWEVRQETARTAATLNSNQQSITQRQAQEDMAQALIQFKDQFPGLNDDDIATIRTEAAPLVANYMQSLPPVEALRRSMEVAGYANSDLRSKLIDPANATPTQQQKSTKRKARLGSISGTPRSAPKVDSRPTYQNDREMVQGFADALAEQGLGR